MTARPIRVQLRRTKGWKMPPNTVKVDRSTRWGNPFNQTQTYTNHAGGVLLPLRCPASLDRCLDLFQAFAFGMAVYNGEWLKPLRGKNLACWCPLDQPCHADALLELANAEVKP